MILAVVARVSFILTNNALLKIPSLASKSTTITTFITLFSLILVVLANWFFLDEKLDYIRVGGMSLIMFGIFITLR